MNSPTSKIYKSVYVEIESTYDIVRGSNFDILYSTRHIVWDTLWIPHEITSYPTRDALNDFINETNEFTITPD